MRQRYSCPGCGSPVRYGDEFCLDCDADLIWERQLPPPPPPRMRRVAPIVTMKPVRAIPQYEPEEYYEEEFEDYPVQEQYDWGQGRKAQHANWRTVSISMLASLIVIGILLGVFQIAVWKSADSPLLAAANSFIKTIQASAPASSPAIAATTNNKTQSNAKQTNIKLPK